MSNTDLETVRTKVVGSMMGDVGEDGIPVRQAYLRELSTKEKFRLKLEREPNNPYDVNAIKVVADTIAGPMHLGYIQNRDRVCTNPDCAIEVRKSADELCPECGAPLTREGLASKMAELMDNGKRYRVEGSITGGDGPDKSGKKKNYGCNIVLHAI